MFSSPPEHWQSPCEVPAIEVNMLKATTTRGICAACQHDPDCTYDRNFDHPPLQCEQFEMGFRKPEIVSPRAISELERMVGIHSPQESASIRVLGLCANCEHQETCTYPKPQGGVWRCEEYQ